MADDKKPDDKKADEKKLAEAKATEADKKAAEERAAAEAVAPRPDPVGERNYAMGVPIVRPEGEGTPGAMRHVAPPVPPVKSDEPEPDDEVKTTDAKTHRQTVAPTVPVKPPPAPIKK